MFGLPFLLGEYTTSVGSGVRGSWRKEFQRVEGNIALRGKKKYYWFLHATRLDVSLRSNMYLGETKLVFFFS